MIVETDLGRGFLKAMGNPAGTHALASELVGTQLAEWIGLPTLDYGLIQIDEQLDSIRLYSGGLAKTGTGFISRWEAGDVWDGSTKQLRRLINPNDISRMVVFDSWVMNCDRKSRLMSVTDNVFLRLTTTPGRVELVAIDHTHCFTTSDDGNVDLTRVTVVDDADVFGLFPEFREFLDRPTIRSTAARLRTLEKSTVQAIVGSIPVEWSVSTAARNRLVQFILARAMATSQTIENRLFGPLPRQEERRPEEPEDQS